jgi:hypothetical protein
MKATLITKYINIVIAIRETTAPNRPVKTKTPITNINPIASAMAKANLAGELNLDSGKYLSQIWISILSKHITISSPQKATAQIYG